MSEDKDTEFVPFVLHGASPQSRPAYMCMERERYERLIGRPTSLLEGTIGRSPWEGNMKSLWPSDISSKVEGSAPVTKLKQQASFLAEKTARIVTAEVSGAIIDVENETGGDFIFDFSIVCLAVGDYRYRLFRIRYDLDFYPLTVEVDQEIRERLPKEIRQESDRVIVKLPDEFETVLEAIFADKKTRRIIDALLMQSKEGQ